ncbi:Uncharacterized protein Rs2_18531 [Raphanus sativus]|nr:Uncharacterized protein Rs2_18531 [Raphanus sativus]
MIHICFRDSIKQKPTSSPLPSSKVVSFSSSSQALSLLASNPGAMAESSLIKTNFDLCWVQTVTKLRFSRNGFSDQAKHTFKNLLKVDDFYRIDFLPTRLVVASVESLRFVQVTDSHSSLNWLPSFILLLSPMCLIFKTNIHVLITEMSTT